MHRWESKNGRHASRLDDTHDLLKIKKKKIYQFSLTEYFRLNWWRN
jgi:hypothetical protein